MADDNLNYTPSLDEIVFENRNKEYGAYDLRTKYPKVLTKSFLIGTAFFLLLAVSPLIYLKIQELTAKDKTEVDANLVNILEEQPIIEQPKDEPPPPPPPKEEEKQEVIQNVVPEPKRVPKIETPPPPITEQLKTTTGLENQEGVKTPAYAPPPPPPGPGKAATAEVVSTTEVYESVDQNAVYPGDVRRFISDNVDTSGFEGEGKLTVRVKFVVERDGTVSDVKAIQKSSNNDFDNEVIRVVKKLKKWTPGKKNGESVRSYFSVPVTMQFE